MKIYEQITPETWCQGSLYRGASGASVSREAATSRCTLGWIAFSSVEVGDYYRKSENFMSENGIRGPLGTWNDAPERTFEEVQAAFKKADL